MSRHGNNKYDIINDSNDDSDDDDDVVIGSSASLTRFRNEKNTRNRNPTIYEDPDTRKYNRDWNSQGNGCHSSKELDRRNKYQHEQRPDSKGGRSRESYERGNSGRSKGNLSAFLDDSGGEVGHEEKQRRTSNNTENGKLTQHIITHVNYICSLYH